MARVPPRRLLRRTVWLALPVSVALLVLAWFEHLAPRAALLACTLFPYTTLFRSDRKSVV